jgi:hypothetical protein
VAGDDGTIWKDRDGTDPVIGGDIGGGKRKNGEEREGEGKREILDSELRMFDFVHGGLRVWR